MRQGHHHATVENGRAYRTDEQIAAILTRRHGRPFKTHSVRAQRIMAERKLRLALMALEDQSFLPVAIRKNH